MSKVKIVREAFREWLAENPDLTFKAASSCECPLAIYLGSGCDREVSVDVDTTMIDGQTYDNPPWMFDFIGAVDAFQGPITGEQALKLL
jgi:hypothetical protein